MIEALAGFCDKLGRFLPRFSGIRLRLLNPHTVISHVLIYQDWTSHLLSDIHIPLTNYSTDRNELNNAENMMYQSMASCVAWFQQQPGMALIDCNQMRGRTKCVKYVWFSFHGNKSNRVVKLYFHISNRIKGTFSKEQIFSISMIYVINV